MRRVRRTARGLTMLEVVFAVVMLALVAVSVSGTITFLARVQADDRQRLGGYELANRKILEFLDDKNSIGSRSAPQEIGGFRYFWDLKEYPLRMTAKQSEAAARSAAQLSTERFSRIEVTVWLVDESASRGTNQTIRGDEIARLSRVCDPTFGALFRNPDSRDNGIMKGDLLQDIMRQLGTPGGLPKAGAAPTAPVAPPPRPGGTTKGTSK